MTQKREKEVTTLSRIFDQLTKLNKVLKTCPELTLVGNPVLRTECVEVALQEGLDVAEKLKVVLLKNREITGYGRGLAAPQIGLTKKVFVTYAGDKFKAYINPLIVSKSMTTNFYRELCLSSGCLWPDVERPEWVILKYTDESGETVEEKAEGFFARLLQHEEDHMHGVVNLDKAVLGSIEFVTKDPLKEVLRDATDIVH